MSSDSEMFISLADVVKEIRSELKKAHEEKDPEFNLKVENIEVELTAALTKEVGGKVSVKVPFWGAGAETNGKVNAINTQKIKLSLSAEHINKETGEKEDLNISASRRKSR